jgi:hypothetical protein
MISSMVGQSGICKPRLIRLIVDTSRSIAKAISISRRRWRLLKASSFMQPNLRQAFVCVKGKQAPFFLPDDNSFYRSLTSCASAAHLMIGRKKNMSEFKIEPVSPYRTTIALSMGRHECGR